MTTYRNFKIVAKLQGAEINKAWNDNKPRNKYFVYVTNTDNGEKTRFTFWDSLDNTQRGVILDGDELLTAFYFFVSDAFNGSMSFEDFKIDFGYGFGNDPNGIECKRIYNACKRSFVSFSRVSGLDACAMCDFVNELQEIAG